MNARVDLPEIEVQPIYRHQIEEYNALQPFGDDPNRALVRGRYSNANGYAAAIVAVLTFTGKDTHSPAGPGALIDWAVYLGGTDQTGKELEGLVHIAEDTGDKMSARDANYFFPNLPIDLYRG